MSGKTWAELAELGRELKHLEGKRVRVVTSTDPYDPLPAGLEGTVTLVDGVGTVHVEWDNGRTLGLVHGADSWEVLVLDGDADA